MFIVDCRSLAGIVNGLTPLYNDGLQECFESMLSNLEGLLEEGRFSSGLWNDPVKWAPREHNIVADYLCNYTMDHQKNWHQVYAECLPADFNLLVHSDGGARATCGAAAWIVEACFLEGDTFVTRPVASSGVYLDGRISSFDAEAWALYHAVAFCKTFIWKH